MELPVVRFPFLYNPPHHTSSGGYSVPAVIFRGSQFHSSSIVPFLFFAFICRFVLVGGKGYLFAAITGVSLKLLSASAFDLEDCLLQS